MKKFLFGKLKTAIVCLLVCLLALGGLTSCGTSQTDSWAGYSMDSYYFDTICRITIYGLDDSLIGEGLTEDEFGDACSMIIKDAFKKLAAYENMLSRTKEGSDVYRINHSSGEEVAVDPETIEVLKAALTCGDMSGGTFDITIGGVSELWNFHALDEETAAAGLPDEEALSEALKHVGIENIVVNFADNWVKLRDPDTVIDLGGIAKGYIADRITEFLKEQGVTDAIVNLGGNIEALGGKPVNHLKPRGDSSESGTVRIGINDPRDDSGKLLMTFDTRDVTVVTSGTYERYIEVDGVRYHHILDPKTGYPVDNGLIQVTIVGARKHSVYCDGLSTICLALGLEDGKALIDDLSAKQIFGPVWAVFVTTDGEVVEAGEKPSFVD
ncbi:MAG: FAD:protein FMN transferase [Firmicutes bacterium]|nr:FAD:protein FMN transferase [Bacillota bacterium]